MTEEIVKQAISALTLYRGSTTTLIAGLHEGELPLIINNVIAPYRDIEHSQAFLDNLWPTFHSTVNPETEIAKALATVASTRAYNLANICARNNNRSLANVVRSLPPNPTVTIGRVEYPTGHDVSHILYSMSAPQITTTLTLPSRWLHADHAEQLRNTLLGSAQQFWYMTEAGDTATLHISHSNKRGQYEHTFNGHRRKMLHPDRLSLFTEDEKMVLARYTANGLREEGSVEKAFNVSLSERMRVPLLPEVRQVVSSPLTLPVFSFNPKNRGKWALAIDDRSRLTDGSLASIADFMNVDDVEPYRMEMDGRSLLEQSQLHRLVVLPRIHPRHGVRCEIVGSGVAVVDPYIVITERDGSMSLKELAGVLRSDKFREYAEVKGTSLNVLSGSVPLGSMTVKKFMMGELL